MLDGAGGLEGRERPPKGPQRKAATVAGASWRNAEPLRRSGLERHRGEAPVEDLVPHVLSDLRNEALSPCSAFGRACARPPFLLRRRTAQRKGLSLDSHGIITQYPTHFNPIDEHLRR